MNDDLQDYVAEHLDDPYDGLPAPLKHAYSREQYAWLSDMDKATLLQRESEPDA